MSTGDIELSGCLKEVVKNEKIKKKNQIILYDRKMSLLYIAGILKISKERVEHIVQEY